ncbi:unnamed protein product [Diatraea saccharalis]|uniref:Cytochrome P450 n=1 Tax=Diatraea saccharalis TaxID=40085 RepID=A0A9N9RF04_9NEOP|nr:unnamed protein product [Diatraea saccharalis]
MLQTMFLYILAAAIILCILHIIFLCTGDARLVRQIPGPKDVFIIGNTLELLITPVELFKLGRRYANKWKDIYRFIAFNIRAVNIFNPEDIEVVMSTMKHSEKSYFYSFLRPWLGDGLLLSGGEKWKGRRKILTPAFHFNILQQFHEILDQNSRRLVEEISFKVGKPIDLVPLLSDFTLNSICETAMGTRLESSKSARIYKENIYEIGKCLVERFSKMYLYSPWIFNLTSIARKQKACVSAIHEFTGKVIRERKYFADQQRREIISSLSDDLNKKNKKIAMLDLLLTAERDGLIDNTGVQEEVDTFMFEGHDTTAAGLTFCLMLLANNPQVQDKIVAEMKQEIGDSNQRLTIEDLSKLKYLERCIKESLRLYPPVPFISRILDSPEKLSNYTVPAGTYCHIHIYDLHRREDLFEIPNAFNPDRFLPENSVGRHPYSYIPFSAGPRNCIGQKFAMLEMKTVIATILKSYLLKPVTTPADIQIHSDLVLRNSGPVEVIFLRRLLT